MDWRRRREFWQAAVRRLPATYGNAVSAIGALAAILAVVGVGAFAGVLQAAALAVALLLLVVAEATFQEWSKWAPHDPPDATVELDTQAFQVDLVVTNHDVPGYMRLSITEAHCQTDMGLGIPWLMVWDTGNTERHFLRGEQARMRMVQFDQTAAVATSLGNHVGPVFQFGKVGAPAAVDGVGLQAPWAVQFAFRLSRVDPPTGPIERSVLATFWPAGVEAHWIQSPSSAAISSQDQT